MTEEDAVLAETITQALGQFLASMTGPIRRTAPQAAAERNRIDERIKDFDYERSTAWFELQRRGWDRLNQAELLRIAQILGTKTGISIDREAKRRKGVLVKWFDENMDLLGPKMGFIKLIFDGSQEW